jgi:hypothetical protein
VVVSSLRSPLPSGRAVVGGLLVAVAVAGTYAIGTGDDRPAVTVLVASRDLDAGQPFDDQAVTALATDLAPELVAVAMPADALERLADQPHVFSESLRAGEMLMASDVTRADGPALAYEVSVPLGPGSSGLVGSVEHRDRVDVIASGDDCTAVLVSGARVNEIVSSGGALGSSGGGSVVLGVPTRQDAVAVAHALEFGTIRLAKAISADAQAGVVTSTCGSGGTAPAAGAAPADPTAAGSGDVMSGVTVDAAVTP